MDAGKIGSAASALKSGVDMLAPEEEPAPLGGGSAQSQDSVGTEQGTGEMAQMLHALLFGEARPPTPGALGRGAFQ